MIAATFLAVVAMIDHVDAFVGTSVAAPDLWVLVAAALIPYLASAAVAPEAPNSWRTAVALVACGGLAAAQAIVDTDGSDAAMAGGAFATAVIAQLGSYRLAHGFGLDPNSSIIPGVGLRPRRATIEDY